MRLRITGGWVGLVGGLMLFFPTVHAQTTISNQTFSNATTYAEAAGKRIIAVMGQPAMGLSYSANNIVSSGFWQQETGIVTSIEPVTESELPQTFDLFQNYPNPFNPSTIISFAVPQNANVRLDVYDMLGRLVSTLIDSPMSPGVYKVTFDASGFASGMYLYRMSAGSFSQTRKLILLR